MRRLQIGMARINATVGNFAGNTRKILQTTAEAKSSGVDQRYARIFCPSQHRASPSYSTSSAG